MLANKLKGAGGLVGAGGGGFPVTENLILLLDANDSSSYPGSGTDWFDLSPEGNDGVLTNGPVYNSTYFEFDGDNDYVELGTITTANPLQLSSPAGGGLSISFAAWFDGTGDSFQRIIDKSNSGAGSKGYCIYNTGTGGTALELQQNTLFQSRLRSTESAIIFSTWAVFTITFNSSTGAWVWYKNGSIDSSGAVSYSIPTAQTNARIATWNHTDARELDGRIGFIAVHEKPVTSTEASDIFNHYKDIYGL